MNKLAIAFALAASVIVPVAVLAEGGPGPTLTIDSFAIATSSNLTAVPLAGTCAAGLPVDVSVDGGTPQNLKCTSGAWSTTFDLSYLSSSPDGSLTATASSTDVDGNTTIVTLDSYKDTVAPEFVNALSDMIVEATGPSGAAVTFSPTATDVHDGTVAATCTPASGSSFGFGSTTVTCNATDAAGNTSASASFEVGVYDRPHIDSMSDITAVAAGPTGAVVTYTPATHDAVDGNGTASCTPASGSTFGLGDTTVTCNATDVAGNHAAPTAFTVHVPVTLSIDSFAVASPSNLTAVLISGSCIDTFPVDVRVGNIAASTVCSAGRWSATLNLSSFGEATLTANASSTDGLGTSATASRDTYKDTVPPLLTMLGLASISIAVNNRYVDPGFVVYDSHDQLLPNANGGFGAISSTTGAVDTSTPGTYVITYVITYGAVDAAGNLAQKQRTVTVSATSLSVATTTSGSDVVGTLDATVASTTFGGSEIDVSIPAGTTITGSSTWDGTFGLPAATTTFAELTPENGFTTSAISAVVVGLGDTPLFLSKAIKIVFAGQAGNLVGWSRGATFTQITDVCDSTTTPTLADGADCKGDSGADLVVWTKHLTTFVTYVEKAIPPPPPAPAPASSGGGGGGGPIWQNSITPATISGAPTSGSVSSGGGEVLGAQTYRFTKYLVRGSKGDAVINLQKLLIAKKLLAADSTTGYFGLLTQAALKQYQKQNTITQTGTAGPLTRAALNKETVPF